MANRSDEPNASYYSARYSERKRAQQRARDAAAGPRTCNKCPDVCVSGSIFCGSHKSEYEALCKRVLAAGESVDAISDFCQRTHWPHGVDR